MNDRNNYEMVSREFCEGPSTACDEPVTESIRGKKCSEDYIVFVLDE